VEGGTFQSKKLAKASHDYLFVWLHQTEPDSCESYKLVTEEFLEETFLHPAYIYLRPDGTEIDKDYRAHHMAVAAQPMLKILSTAQREWGRGLSEKEYAEGRETMAKALGLFVDRQEAEAAKLLRGVAKLRARCGLRERAKAMLVEMEIRKRLLADWTAREGVREGLAKSVERTLRNGELVTTFRTLVKAGDDAAKDFLPVVTEALRETIRLRPLRMDKVYADNRAYYYLRAEWATDLMPFSGLTVTLAYVTEKGKTLEGFAKYDRMRPYKRHRAATSLSSRMLRLQDLTNARIQLWIDDFLLAESHWKDDGPKEFPYEESNVVVGPDLLREEETLGAGVKADLRRYSVGRYPPAR